MKTEAPRLSPPTARASGLVYLSTHVALPMEPRSSISAYANWTKGTLVTYSIQVCRLKREQPKDSKSNLRHHKHTALSKRSGKQAMVHSENVQDEEESITMPTVQHVMEHVKMRTDNLEPGDTFKYACSVRRNERRFLVRLLGALCVPLDTKAAWDVEDSGRIIFTATRDRESAFHEDSENGNSNGSCKKRAKHKKGYCAINKGGKWQSVKRSPCSDHRAIGIPEAQYCSQ